MVTFATPEYLLLLLLLVPLAVLLWISADMAKKDRRALGDARLIRSLLRAPGSRSYKIRSLLLLGTVTMLIISMARPRIGRTQDELRTRGLQIMVIFDGSRSMAVQDVQPNRFEVAKRVVLRLFQDLEGSEMGMLIFGEASQVHFPLTSDMAAARALVEPLSVEALNFPGSNLQRAIEDAQRSFLPGQTRGRIILILSDGGDPEQDRDNAALEQARKAAAAGIRIYAVGAGTLEGDRVPYRDERGRRAFKVDPVSGEEVISTLNKDLLDQLATTTGGRYFDAADLDSGELVDALSDNAVVDITDQSRQTEIERFQVLIVLALLLLAAEYLLLGRRGDV
jgi:Ca-activated chloride channel homolog